jgi:hypothetical protein
MSFISLIASAGRFRERRPFAILATLSLILTGSVLGVTGTAAASTDALVCTPPSSQTTTYDPPLTAVSTTTTLTG